MQFVRPITDFSWPRSAYLLAIGRTLGIAVSDQTAQRMPTYQLLLHPLIGCVGVQQPFLNPHSHGSLTQSPLNLLGISVMAVLSYLLVERPLLQIKDRRCLVEAPLIEGSASRAT